ncbi:MAG: mechanosensitive ion channel [Betaproteobacteria bacterium]|nr:mechanosensitive ion channel [Betaproteobacteria bacterium]
MDISTLATSVQNSLGPQILGIIGALGVLALGWFVAVLIRAGVRRTLALIGVDRRIESSAGRKMQVESGIAMGAFWLVILITLIGVFNSLDLPLISSPFQTLVNEILGYVPQLIAGTLLTVLAWVVAIALRAIVNRLLAATDIDDRLSREAGMRPMSKSVGDMLFWLVLLLFLPAILGAFEITGLLDPVKSMVTDLVAILPNIFAALVIGAVGWILGKVLSNLTANILGTAGVDRVVKNVGLDDSVRLSRLLGTIVFILVFIPALIAALDALKIESISRPATDMLGQMLAAVPNIIAAALILTITFYVARFAAQLVAKLLTGLGFDGLPEKMGLGAPLSGAWKPSSIVAGLIQFFAMLFATVEAANRLDFGQVRDVVTMFITFAGDILLGGAIFVIGFWLAGLAATAINRAGGAQSGGMARIARFAILGLVIAMGLRAMGIADDIVNLAFALTFGAVAVAVALAFGLGGREAAGRQMEHWLARLRGEK